MSVSLNLQNKNYLNNAKKESYNRIYAHEMAHKSKAGSLGGPIVIEKDKDGFAYVGHVDIKMPQLNPQNPDETIKQAQIVIDSALAPKDPSSQDYKVAHEAKQILSKAQNIKNGLKLNYLA